MPTAATASPHRDNVDPMIASTNLDAQLHGIDYVCADPVDLFIRDYDSIAGKVTASSSATKEVKQK